MADRKAVIKNADMAEDMQQDAVDCATQALEKFNIEKDIAAFIKKEFDKKYVRNFIHLQFFKGTIPPGTAWWAVTLDRTSPTRRSTSFTFTSGRWPSSCSSLVNGYDNVSFVLIKLTSGKF